MNRRTNQAIAKKLLPFFMPWAFRPREEKIIMNDSIELTRTKEFIRKKIEDTYLTLKIETDEGCKNGWIFGDNCCFDVDGFYQYFITDDFKDMYVLKYGNLSDLGEDADLADVDYIHPVDVYNVDFNDAYPLEIRLNDYCDIEINDPLDFLLWNKEFFCADEMDVKEIKAVEINECMKLIGNRIQIMQ